MNSRDFLRAALEELRDEPLDKAALARVRRRALERIAAPTAPRRWLWTAWTAAAACALMIALAVVTEVPPPEPPPPPPVGRPFQAATGFPPGVRSGAARKRRPTKRVRNAEPLLIRLATSDPDVVIYWTVEGKGD